MVKKKRGKKLGRGYEPFRENKFWIRGVAGKKTCFVGWFVPHPPPKLIKKTMQARAQG